MTAFRAYEKQDLIQRDMEDTKELLSQLNSKLDRLLESRQQVSDKAELQSEADRLLDEVPLYVITPTYPRMTQLSEITRLGQALKVNSSKRL